MTEIETNLYTADRRPLADSSVWERLLPLVSTDRRKTIARLRFDKDRQLSLAAGLLLRHALREAGYEPAPEELRRDEHQKLFWPRHPELRFNLSHSENLALCVISDCSAGCDIQFCGEVKPGLARRFFHPTEAEALEKIEDAEKRKKEFFRLWALKESYMKCTGLGFSLALDSFAIRTEPAPPRLSIGPDVDAFRFFEWALDDYRLACCLKNYHGDIPSLYSVSLTECFP